MTKINFGLSLLILHVVIGSSSKGTSQDIDWFKIAQNELKRALKVNKDINTNIAKNVIFINGDGLDHSTATAARILKGQMNGLKGEENLLEFEKFPHTGLSKTYCAEKQGCEQASSATALFCGVKTNFRVVGLSDKAHDDSCTSRLGAEIPCMAEWFADAGKHVGIVTKSAITGGGTAPLYAESPNRSWEGDARLEGVEGGCVDIAKQFVFNNSNIKVAFGGGRTYFLTNTTLDPEDGEAFANLRRRDKLDLVNIWLNAKRRFGRATYVWNNEQFNNIDPSTTDFALGLFSPFEMQPEAERDRERLGEPSLPDMTAKAIQIMKKSPNGYFLYIHNNQIDDEHHRNRAKRALLETLELEKAVIEAVRRTSERDTLIIVSSTFSQMMKIAGLSDRGNDILGLYDVHAYPLKGMCDDMKVKINALKGCMAMYRSLEKPADEKYKNWYGSFKSYNDTLVSRAFVVPDGIPWTTLAYTNGPGYDFGKRINNSVVDTASLNFTQPSASPISGSTHGADDVGIYARGPMSHLFHTVHEQHYIAHVMAYAACVGPYKSMARCNRKNRY